jgi:hypothetical protein
MTRENIMFKTTLLAFSLVLGLTLEVQALNGMDKFYLMNGVQGGCVGESRDCNDTVTRDMYLNDYRAPVSPEITMPELAKPAAQKCRRVGC